MRSLKIEADDEEYSYQITMRDDGWKFRESGELQWSHWTDKKHSTDLVELQLEMWLKGRDIR